MKRVFRFWAGLFLFVLIVAAGIRVSAEQATRPASNPVDGAAKAVKAEPAAEAAPGPRRLLVVQSDDKPTTAPIPKDIPELKNLHKLMEKMNSAGKKCRDKNAAVAARAAREVEKLTLAAMHPRLTVKEEEFQKFLAQLYLANQDVQKALENPTPANRPALLKALRDQGNACSACHRKYHPEED